MKPHVASAVHAFTLIAMAGWGYFATDSKTALIPVVFGVLLLVMNNGVRNENKVVAHIAVLLTLLAVLGVAKPFMNQLDQGDTMGMVRTGAMIVTGIYAMITFIQSFRAARKAKA